jgi:V/A-type H+-transporting ATPase subunit E
VDTDVAAFARQLRQDGIDAARAEAERILAQARAQAAETLRQAREAAGAAQADARAAIERERQRFAVELGMAARDTMLMTRQDIERVVMRLLRARIGDALAVDEVVRKAILELIGGAARDSVWEIAVGPRIGKAG